MSTVRAQTLVIIPAQNEAAVIAPIVDRVKALGLDVLVVDDFSKDTTAQEAQEAGARVIQLSFHAGAWAAMQTGIQVAWAEGYDYVVTMDGDGQHAPEDIPKLLDAIQDTAHRTHVVIGSCLSRGNKRRRVAWRLLRLISGVCVKDITSGFRIYDRQAIEILSATDCTLLEYQDIGVLLHLHRLGLSMREVPVEMGARQQGQSRIFSSWGVVAYYMAYSILLSISRRAYIGENRKKHRK